MIIKDKNRQPLFSLGHRARIVVVSLLLFLGALSYYLYSRELVADPVYRTKQQVKEYRNVFLRQLVSKFLADPEHLTIDIEHMDFQRLAYKRAQALETGVLMAKGEDYVPAEVRYNNETIRVKMRLKGDWIDHLKGDKWSFRIKVRGDNTIFGMKQFSLQHPNTRNYIYEWIWHQALQREGVLSLRYDFVKVTMNGRDLGVYALEEHFEKRLIEHNRYREGPIVKFNEDALWADRARNFGPPEPESAYYSSAIDVFKQNRTFADSSLREQFLVANNLLEHFRMGKLPPSRVFDLDNLARYYAVSDLLGAHHMQIYHNLRFYYNPITSLLQPVAFDGQAGQEIVDVLGSYGRHRDNTFFDFDKRLFADDQFTRLYHGHLERISRPAYLDSLLSDLADDTSRYLNILYSEFRDFIFYRDVLHKNRETIQKALNPIKGIHAYLHDTDAEYLTVAVGNAQSLPVEIVEATYRDSVVMAVQGKILLEGKNPRAPVSYQTIRFAVPGKLYFSQTGATELDIRYRILGVSRVEETTIFPYEHLSQNFIEQNFMRREPNVREFPMFDIDTSRKQIRIKRGNWQVQKSVIIPAEFTVLCGPGVNLDLRNEAVLLSYSPLEFVGTEDEPVRFFSSDSTGQGLAVLNAESKSILQWVRFENLSAPRQQGWELSGAVTFYESPVDLINCGFAGNHSEDALNIFRSDFSMEKSQFVNIYSDGFDGDFVNGTIRETAFYKCGNDAIDISGSVLTVDNVVISEVGDKGLSAGEHSNMKASRITIKNSEIAVASKDLSEVQLADAQITDSRIGFTAFQKKSEFGAASIIVSGLTQENLDVPYLIEQGSSLLVNGEPITSDAEEVKEMLYGVKYGKASN